MFHLSISLCSYQVRRLGSSSDRAEAPEAIGGYRSRGKTERSVPMEALVLAVVAMLFLGALAATSGADSRDGANRPVPGWRTAGPEDDVR